MPASFSKFVVASFCATQATGLVLSGPGMPSVSAPARANPLVMSDATRDPSPLFDNGMSGWKPPGGGGDAHGGSGFSSTDVPDFLPEEGSELDKLSKGISYTDGMMGSQNNKQTNDHSGPELQGALDSDPAIYVPDALEVVKDESMFVLPEPEFRIDKMEVSATHEDFEFFCSSTESGKIIIDVKPVCMTFEDFFCGFTADSHPSFSVSPDKGTMERRNGPPTQLQVTW